MESSAGTTDAGSLPRIATVDEIADRVRANVQSNGPPCLVAIGGCARSGKSTLADRLTERLGGAGLSAVTLSADHWIVDVRLRGVESRVEDRFEGDAFDVAVETLLAGQPVYPPVYDVVRRQRVAERSTTPVSCADIVIAEGVITLLRPRIRSRAAVTIYVHVPDAVRVDRLVDFYERIKKLPAETVSALIRDRDQEEVRTVVAAGRTADLSYVGVS